MAKISQDSERLVEHLNTVLRTGDPLTFQKVLLNFALGHRTVVEVAKLVGVRRETIWRYQTGAAKAPMQLLAKILTLVGAKLVVVRDAAS
jgi:DNA-binding phage protein